jgi:hypothetical protein
VGKLVKANCACGYKAKEEILVGGLRSNYRTLCCFPFLCRDCDEVFEGDLYVYRNQCPTCSGENITSYEDPSLYQASEDAQTFIETRLRHFLAKRSTRDSELRALLVIDGDDSVDPMPLFESAISQLHQEVINGDIDRTHDLEALQVAWNALLRGYQIFRLPYAKRLGIKTSELDTRVTRILRTWLEAMSQPPSNTNQKDNA